MSGPVHGGGLDAAIARYGGNRADWLDLSTGINPRAYPIGRIDKTMFERLPDEAAFDALIATARRLYAMPDHLDIVAGAGAQACTVDVGTREPTIRVDIPAAEVAAYLDRGRRAEAAGHVGSARCSYRVVARRGNEEQKRFALARLAAIDAVDKGISLATSDR